MGGEDGVEWEGRMGWIWGRDLGVQNVQAGEIWGGRVVVMIGRYLR